MAFLADAIFPNEIRLESVIGPSFVDVVFATDGGGQSVNQAVTLPLRQFDLSQSALTFNEAAAALEHFLGVDGSRNTWPLVDISDFATNQGTDPADKCRWRDPDFITPTDEFVAIYDGVTVAPQFQLIKTYSAGTASVSRPIKLVDPASVRVALDGAEITTGFSVDSTTGILTVDDTLAGMVVNAQVTAGFSYSVEVRYAPGTSGGFDSQTSGVNDVSSPVLAQEEVYGVNAPNLAPGGGSQTLDAQGPLPVTLQQALGRIVALTGTWTAPYLLLPTTSGLLPQIDFFRITNATGAALDLRTDAATTLVSIGNGQTAFVDLARTGFQTGALEWRAVAV